MTPSLIEAKSVATVDLLASFTEKPTVAARSSSRADSIALFAIPYLSRSLRRFSLNAVDKRHSFDRAKSSGNKLSKENLRESYRECVELAAFWFGLIAWARPRKPIPRYGFGITSERLSVPMIGSMVSMREVPPPGGRRIFPLHGRRCHAHQFAVA
jgi:hypothetical protein